MDESTADWPIFGRRSLPSRVSKATPTVYQENQICPHALDRGHHRRLFHLRLDRLQQERSRGRRHQPQGREGRDQGFRIRLQ